jgi:hypothetical protein
MRAGGDVPRRQKRKGNRMNRERDNKYEFVAVDFDGTLCENEFPLIGKPIPEVIEYVKRLAANGSKIILYTSREDGEHYKFLSNAVGFCREHGIPLFAVNENPENPYPAFFGTGPARKVFADLYIDDKALHPHNIRSCYAGPERTESEDRK